MVGKVLELLLCWVVEVLPTPDIVPVPYVPPLLLYRACVVEGKKEDCVVVYVFEGDGPA